MVLILIQFLPSLGENVPQPEPLSPGSLGGQTAPPGVDGPSQDMCSPCSPCSPTDSIVVRISEEERHKYEDEIRKLYKQLDDKVMDVARGWGDKHIDHRRERVTHHITVDTLSFTARKQSIVFRACVCILHHGVQRSH